MDHPAESLGRILRGSLRSTIIFLKTPNTRPEGAEQISLGQSDAARTASDALGGESLFSPYLPVPINFGMPKIGTYHHNPAAAISSTKSASSPSTSSTAASKSSESSSARDVTRAIGVFG